MILVLLIGFTLLTFVSWLLISAKLLRWVFGTISSLLLVGTISIVSLHLHSHFGMEEVTETTEATIYTAGDLSSPANLLIVSEIGTASDNYAMVFRDNSDDEESSAHFVPDEDNIIDSVKLTASYQTAAVTEATVQTTTTSWDFSNDFYRSLFSFEDREDEIVSEKVIMTVPENTWVVLTDEQAEALQDSQSQQTAEEQAASQAAVQTAVQAAVSQYLSENPSATQDEIASYTKQATSEIAVAAIKAQLANE